MIVCVSMMWLFSSKVLDFRIGKMNIEYKTLNTAH